MGQTVTVTMDRPMGFARPHLNMTYPVNYGYIEGVIAPDGDDLDAYYLGVDKPLGQATGVCIAICHRLDDDDDKLVVVPEGVEMTDDQIREQTHFQEQYFKSEIVR